MPDPAPPTPPAARPPGPRAYTCQAVGAAPVQLVALSAAAAREAALRYLGRPADAPVTCTPAE
jgi:hypothetical protein